jgi:pimeloyl-ACP methyl ester carboxylesterase
LHRPDSTGKVAEATTPHKEIRLIGRVPEAIAWHPRFRKMHVWTARHADFWCDTPDGVRLAGSMLGKLDSPTAVVVAHGFMGFRTKPKFRLISEALGEHYGVFAFDLRGHGDSGGLCTGGDREAMDVHAVVQHARRRGFRRIVTVGASLGGIAVIREAAAYRDIDAVVAISTPDKWGGTTKPVQRLALVFGTRSGRWLAKHLGGVRLAAHWEDPLPPIEVVEKIAPTPLLIIHGDNDHFFPPSAAEGLYAAAGDPKRLMIMPGFGHAEDGFTPEFAELLAKEIAEMLPEDEA